MLFTYSTVQKFQPLLMFGVLVIREAVLESFCSITMASNKQAESSRTIFSNTKVRPTQSPDLNILKSVWDYITRQKTLRHE